MKRISLIAALAIAGLLACSTLVNAQDASANTNNPPKKGGKVRFTVEQRLDRMTTALNLTDDQKPKVKAVLEDTQKAMQGLRDLPRMNGARSRSPFGKTKPRRLKPSSRPTRWTNIPKCNRTWARKARRRPNNSVRQLEYLRGRPCAVPFLLAVFLPGATWHHHHQPIAAGRSADILVGFA